MLRTQIYITEEQQAELARRASAVGVSKAEVIRRILDRGLGLDGGEDDDRAAILATAGILSDYPDWPEWQRSVRGRTSDERLSALGL